jgi:glycogen debranching enzyme
LTDIVRLENQYYIRASSGLADDRTRVLKYGDTFAVFNRFGDIEPVGPSQFGLFHAECRHLSRFTLQINGRQPLLLSSTIREDNAFLSVDLTNVDSPSNGQPSLTSGTLHIFRLQFLRKGGCHSQVRLLNYGTSSAVVNVKIRFEADFADIFEVRGTKRTQKGQRLPDEVKNARVTLVYCGLDGVKRQTKLEFSPMPVSVTAQEAQFELHLQPSEEQSIFAMVACENDTDTYSHASFSEAFAAMGEDFDITHLQDCRITTSSEGFNAWLTRSCADLRMLVEGNPEGPYPYAGVPWFNTVFGRDGIITALECLWMAPSFAEGVLKYLAETQAQTENHEQDAEPGKILHEMRRGEMAATKEVPFAKYYGSIDSTPLFVMLAGAYLERTGNLNFIKAIWPNVTLALKWMDQYGDRDKDGFVEYEKRSRHGLIQQGWKDSYDSVFYANGEIAEPPIALCEVQGYCYAAKLAGAQLAGAMNEPDLATKLEASAKDLRAHFEEAFWNEELGTYVLALDGKKKQCAVRASNAGHALFCRIAGDDRARQVAATLMSNQLFSGWGVRTIGSSEARYNPMSYHNGSVWPHDNAILAMGFSHYNLQHEAAKILEGMYSASRQVQLHRMPELFCGFHKRPDGSGPTLYPVACAPQAWAAAAVFLMLQACLGIQVASEIPEIRLSRPYLPPILNEVRIEKLGTGDATADLIFRRAGDHVQFEVLRKKGAIEIRESANSQPFEPRRVRI